MIKYLRTTSEECLTLSLLPLPRPAFAQRPRERLRLRELMCNYKTQRRMSMIAPRSDEHRKRIADSVKAKWADPEYRARNVEGMRAAARARTLAAGGEPKPRRVRRPSGAPRVRTGNSGDGGARARQKSMIKWERQEMRMKVGRGSWVHL